MAVLQPFWERHSLHEVSMISDIASGVADPFFMWFWAEESAWQVEVRATLGYYEAVAVWSISERCPNGKSWLRNYPMSVSSEISRRGFLHGAAVPNFVVPSILQNGNHLLKTIKVLIITQLIVWLMRQAKPKPQRL